MRAKANKEKRIQNPGVDFVVTRAQFDQIDVNQTLVGVASVECYDVNRHLNSLDGEGPAEQSAARKLLADLTNYHFVPNHSTEPFKPMLVTRDRRSFVPTDLLKEQIEIIAEFAPTVDHPGLRARLSDVSWFMQRRRHDMAGMAIDAYCDSVEAVRAGLAEFSLKNKSAWSIGAKNALVRACNISNATRWALPASQRVKGLIADLVAEAHLNRCSDDFWRIADVDLGHQISSPAQIASMAEELAGDKKLANDPESRNCLLQLAARAYRRARDQGSANRCMVEAAECHVQKADIAGLQMLKVAFLQDAIQMLRNCPDTQKRREELSARLRNAQPGIQDEMAHFSTEIDLTKIVKHSVASIRGNSWPTAFLSLVLCDLPPTPDEIRKTTLKHDQEFPLQGVMPMQVHDYQGRVIFSTPGMSGDAAAQEEHLRYRMAVHRGLSRQITVEGAINPIRQTIASEHLVSSEVILEMISESPFIPLGHEYIYARAICHFLSGEDIEAVSLLTPQLENSLRHVLALKGYDTATADANGIQTEASLSILLNSGRPWRAHLEATIPARYVHEIDLLFNFSGGPSVRNQVAHGKVPAGNFWRHDLTYAAWLVIHLVVLPVAQRWGSVEETFARVTGLHRESGSGRASDSAD